MRGFIENGREMKKTQWMIYTKRADFQKLAARFSISPMVARIMINRGIDEEEFYEYLNGSLNNIPDTKLLSGVEEAVAILLQKKAEHKRVRIIGDYDIDGICSTYILVKGLKTAGIDVDYDIPDRLTDGYGLSMRLIEAALRDGIDTIVTCDNGIAALPEVKKARQEGLTVVVTDHHEVGHAADGAERLPAANVIVNPKLADSKYPFREICGASVAWKLIGLLYEKEKIEKEQWENFLLFVAIATIGDVMPLKKENRIIVKEGLKRAEDVKNLGLFQLLSLCELDVNHLTPYHIGFVIGPCLNAGGRLESAKVGLEMLLSEDPDEAERAAKHLKMLNDERRRMTDEGVRAACDQLDALEALPDVLTVYLPGCHESIAGIIAGKLRERYYRPSFVLTDSADPKLLKGSGRSIPGYHMFLGLEECADFLVKFGGHPSAAGLTLRREDLPFFMKRLNEKANLTDECLTEKIWIDIALPFSYVNEPLIQELSKLEPFGQGNASPVFAEKNVRILSHRIFGNRRNVIKLSLRAQEGSVMDAIAFGDGDLFEKEMEKSRLLDIIYYPEIDDYMGRHTVQLRLKGWKFHM